MSPRLLPAPLVLLAFAPGLALAEPVRVAIEQGPSSGGSAADVAAQLDDDTWFDFTATVVTASDIDTADELAAYDVVILSHSGSAGDQDWTDEMAAALRTFVSDGGGVVGAGWIDYALTETTVGGASDLDEVLPIDAYPDSTNYFCYGGTTLDLSATAHPVTDGLPASLVMSASTVEISPLTVETDAIVLGTVGVADGGTCTASPAQALVVGDYCGGRTVYLGMLYGANTGYGISGLRAGDEDQLLEQAVSWAAGGEGGEVLVDADDDGAYEDTDCDDGDAAVYPGASEVVGDERDQDCDGAELCFADADADGYTGVGGGTVASPDLFCDGLGEAGADAATGDCDDVTAAINPDAVEVCDGVDNDCDRTVDIDAVGAGTWYADADADGFTDATVTTTACDAPDGYAAATEADCDDGDATRFPGADDVPADGVDQDCDGADAEDDTDVPDDTDDTDLSDDTGDTEETDTGDTDGTAAGCGCASTDGGGAAWSLVLGVLALTARRRRTA